jgi:hypothetical protein
LTKNIHIYVMVLIHVVDANRSPLTVQTGRDIMIPGSLLKGRPERLRIPDEFRGDDKDPVDLPATWAEWQAAHPQYPLAQIRDIDSKHRQYIYAPLPGFKPVSGTCDAKEDPVVCAARELWEETGLDLRSTPDRFVPTHRDFTVTVSADEKTQIRTTLNARITERKGEIFAFRWAPPGGRRTRRKNGKRHRKTKRRI